MRKPVIVLGAVAAAVAAWQVAASLLFLAVLGFWSTYPWPDRLWMWIRYAVEAPPNAIVHRWLIITAAVPVLLPLLIAVPFVAHRRNGSTKPVYGKTNWADRKEMTDNNIATTRRPF